jgi:hypothetical protein
MQASKTDHGTPPLVICRVMRYLSCESTRKHDALGGIQKDAEEFNACLAAT